MKNYLKALIILILTLFSCKVLAFTAPPPPTNGTFIVDLANKLSPQQLSTLNSKIEGIKTSSKNEFGVLILQSMDGESIDDVAYTTFNSWGVGHKGLDNGVLLVIAASERKTRIETGKGVGELTNTQCNDILKNTLRPFLKSGDYFGGINATIDAASSAIDSRKNAVIPPVSNNDTPTESDNFGATLIFAFFGLLVVSVVGYFIIMFFVNKNEEDQRRLEQDEEDRLDLERQQNQMKNTAPEAPEPLAKRQYRTSTAIAIGVGAAAAVGGTAIAISLEESDKKRRRDQERRDEEDRARRRREEDDRNSSSSSYSSSSDSGSSWGGSDSGSSFDGGSSGGGGSDGSF